MITTFVGMVIVALILLAAIGVVFIDVFKILKLVNHETDVDMIEFNKCVFPYKR